MAGRAALMPGHGHAGAARTDADAVDGALRARGGGGLRLRRGRGQHLQLVQLDAALVQRHLAGQAALIHSFPHTVSFAALNSLGE